MTGLFIIRNHRELEHLTPVVARELRHGCKSHLLMLSSERFPNTYCIRHLLEHNACFIPEKDACNANNVLYDQQYDYIVCGWLQNGQYGLEQVCDYLSLARQKGIVTVAIPNDMLPYVNCLVRRADLPEVVSTRNIPCNWTDYIVAPYTSAYRKMCCNYDNLRLIPGRHERYTDEWLNVLNNITPDYNWIGNNDNIKIAMFIPALSYMVNWDEIVSIWKILANYRNVSVVVKQYACKREYDKLSAAYPAIIDLCKTHRNVLPCDFDATGLIKWADWVLDAGTEAGIEAVLRNKPCRTLNYSQSNIILLSEYFPSLAIRCRDDLVNWVSRLSENNGDVPYEVENILLFKKEVIGNTSVDYSAIKNTNKLHLVGEDYIISDKLCVNYTEQAGALTKQIFINDNDLLLNQFYNNVPRDNIDKYSIMKFGRLSKSLILILWRQFTLRGVNRVSLFGAGAHTRWLLHIVKQEPIPKICRIYDDAARVGDCLSGNSVVYPSRDDWDGEPIILSTDVNQKLFSKRCCVIFGKNAQLIDLYAGIDLQGVFPKTWD